MNIAEYISTIAAEGTLAGAEQAAIKDYESHKDYQAVTTWHEVLADAGKSKGADLETDDADDTEDFDYVENSRWLRSFFKAHKIHVLKSKKTKTHVFAYVECPWCENHTSEENETSTFVSIDKRHGNKGMINFHCNHNHCDDKRWADFRNFYEDRDREEAPSKNQAQLIVRKMSEVTIKKTEFLFYPNFPRKLCIVSGYPGAGKTFLLCKLAAAVSTGKDFFQLKTTNAEPANVIYFSSEDGYEDTIAPRLLQCGANMEYISCVDFDDSADFEFADSRFEDLIRHLNPALVIFDTLQNFIGNVNMNAANETTRKMRPLVRIADTYNVCIVCICHFNKNEQGSAITRTIGSTDITGKCRSYMTIGSAPDEENIKYFSHEKSNVGPLGDTILFSVDRFGINYKGTTKMRADDYAVMRYSKKGRPTNAVTEVKKFIIANMPNGKRPASEMLALFTANGFSNSTVQRAKKELRIRSVLDGFGDQGVWSWVAPEGGFDDFEPVDYTDHAFNDDG